jgi:hypothetical protein
MLARIVVNALVRRHRGTRYLNQLSLSIAPLTGSIIFASTFCAAPPTVVVRCSSVSPGTCMVITEEASVCVFRMRIERVLQVGPAGNTNQFH